MANAGRVHPSDAELEALLGVVRDAKAAGKARRSSTVELGDHNARLGSVLAAGVEADLFAHHYAELQREEQERQDAWHATMQAKLEESSKQRISRWHAAALDFERQVRAAVLIQRAVRRWRTRRAQTGALPGKEAPRAPAPPTGQAPAPSTGGRAGRRASVDLGTVASGRLAKEAAHASKARPRRGSTTVAEERAAAAMAAQAQAMASAEKWLAKQAAKEAKRAEAASPAPQRPAAELTAAVRESPQPEAVPTKDGISGNAAGESGPEGVDPAGQSAAEQRSSGAGAPAPATTPPVCAESVANGAQAAAEGAAAAPVDAAPPVAASAAIAQPWPAAAPAAAAAAAAVAPPPSAPVIADRATAPSLPPAAAAGTTAAMPALRALSTTQPVPPPHEPRPPAADASALDATAAAAAKPAARTRTAAAAELGGAVSNSAPCAMLPPSASSELHDDLHGVGSLVGTLTSGASELRSSLVKRSTNPLGGAGARDSPTPLGNARSRRLSVHFPAGSDDSAPATGAKRTPPPQPAPPAGGHGHALPHASSMPRERHAPLLPPSGHLPPQHQHSGAWPDAGQHLHPQPLLHSPHHQLQDEALLRRQQTSGISGSAAADFPLCSELDDQFPGAVDAFSAPHGWPGLSPDPTAAPPTPSLAPSPPPRHAPSSFGPHGGLHLPALSRQATTATSTALSGSHASSPVDARRYISADTLAATGTANALAPTGGGPLQALARQHGARRAQSSCDLHQPHPPPLLAGQQTRDALAGGGGGPAAPSHLAPPARSKTTLPARSSRAGTHLTVPAAAPAARRPSQRALLGGAESSGGGSASAGAASGDEAGGGGGGAWGPSPHPSALLPTGSSMRRASISVLSPMAPAALASMTAAAARTGRASVDLGRIAAPAGGALGGGFGKGLTARSSAVSSKASSGGGAAVPAAAHPELQDALPPLASVGEERAPAGGARGGGGGASDVGGTTAGAKGGARFGPSPSPSPMGWLSKLQGMAGFGGGQQPKHQRKGCD